MSEPTSPRAASGIEQHFIGSIDLEIMLVFRPGCFDKMENVQTHADRYVLPEQAVCQLLNNYGIRAMDISTRPSHPQDLKFSSYGHWRVDVTHHQPNPDEQAAIQAIAIPGFLGSAIKLVSPVYNFAGEGFGAALDQVFAVLRKLEDDFSCHVMANESAGLHVHVGLSSDLVLPKVPFFLAKRILQLMTAHERTFDGLHSAGRITTVPPPPPLAGGVHPDGIKPTTVPLSYVHQWRGMFQRRRWPNTPFMWLHEIESAGNFEQLCQLFWIPWEGPDGTLLGVHATLDLDNLCLGPERAGPEVHREEPAYNISFRQHVSTLDRDAILSYVEVLCCLIRYCAETDDLDFLRLLMRSSDAAYGHSRLLADLGVSKEVIKRYSPDLPRPSPGILRSPGGSFSFSDTRFSEVIEANHETLARQTEWKQVSLAIEAKLRQGCYGWTASEQSVSLTRQSLVDFKTQILAKANPGIDRLVVLSEMRGRFFLEVNVRVAKVRQQQADQQQADQQQAGQQQAGQQQAGQQQTGQQENGQQPTGQQQTGQQQQAGQQQAD